MNFFVVLFFTSLSFFANSLGIASSNKADIEIETRIVGGKPATADVAKTFVSIIAEFDTVSKLCGGYIWQSNVVLSAASCVIDKSEGFSTSIKMAFGGTTTYQFQEVLYINYGTSFDPSKNDSIGNWIDMTLANSIKLSKSIDLAIEDSNTRKEDAYVGKNLIVCGFGNIDNYNTKPKTLQCTTLRVVPVIECGEFTGKGVVCALNNDERNVCAGDIGGPAFINGTSGLKVAAIISYFVDSRPNARCRDGHRVVLTQIGPLYDFT